MPIHDTDTDSDTAIRMSRVLRATRWPVSKRIFASSSAHDGNIPSC
jgi:hypothetical protein